jgi:DNA-binding GntR family transcriptional regulator
LGAAEGMASEVRIREAGPRVSTFHHPEPPRSQSEAAYFLIRDRILSLALPPGSLVHEAQLREELSIGRTPIREALQRLAHEKLVRSVPNRGTFVTDVNITDLARITEVRVVLEGHAARLAAERRTPADRAEIEDLLGELRAVNFTEQRELMKLDQEIHRRVYRCARNAFLESTLERYFNLSLRLWFLVLDRGVWLPEAVAEHRTMLEAILAGDGDHAEQAMRRNVAGFEAKIRRALLER